jgi:hypothetical protein
MPGDDRGEGREGQTGGSERDLAIDRLAERDSEVRTASRIAVGDREAAARGAVLDRP